MSQGEIERRKRDVRERILKALANAPTHEGFTVKELSKETNIPEPTARWYLEVLGASREVDSSFVGKTRLFRIPRKRQQK